MATYVYETIGKPIRRFELRQSMKDAPYTKHPETGMPIRRVITGGYGYAAKAKPSPPGAGGHHCGSGSCGCH
jgi:predicted nucleic acid-binding Zn ribbon protein